MILSIVMVVLGALALLNSYRYLKATYKHWGSEDPSVGGATVMAAFLGVIMTILGVWLVVFGLMRMTGAMTP